MGIDDVEEGLTDLGEIVIDPAVDPGGQEGEPFQKPLDMRVVAAVGLQPEGLGDLLVLLREVGAEPPQEAEFFFVIFLQAIGSIIGIVVA